ncbi:MAG: DUF998 domain-containing protein [Candidatus Hodarchaeota archaeon]
MSLRESINKIRTTIFDKVINFRVIKICGIIAIILYLSFLIAGVIVASIFGSSGYSIIDNWISDLGGSIYTPAPYLYDIACIIAGILTIPITFYMENLLLPLPQKSIDIRNITRLRIRLISSAFTFGLIGSLGYIGVGIFSEDRSYFGLHSAMSILAFVGFVLSAFCIGMYILLYNTRIPKLLGLYGVVGPLTTIIVFFIENNPLWEWILLFSILAWIIPLTLFVFIKKLEPER